MENKTHVLPSLTLNCDKCFPAEGFIHIFSGFPLKNTTSGLLDFSGFERPIPKTFSPTTAWPSLDVRQRILSCYMTCGLSCKKQRWLLRKEIFWPVLRTAKRCYCTNVKTVSAQSKDSWDIMFKRMGWTDNSKTLCLWPWHLQRHNNEFCQIVMV